MSEEIKDARYIQAKIDLLQAQTHGQLWDNELARALAETATIASAREKTKSNWELAAPSLHRVYYLTGEIAQSSAHSLIDTLSRWDRIDADKPELGYTIIMCSPGGDVIFGFQLYSFLRGLAARREITISAAGLCASMATVIHQAATPGCRIVEPGCSYLLHEVSGGVGGRYDAIADTADWMKQLNRTMHEIFAERSGVLTAEEIGDRISRREKFLKPEEVIEWGLADQIRYVP